MTASRNKLDGAIYEWRALSPPDRLNVFQELQDIALPGLSEAITLLRAAAEPEAKAPMTPDERTARIYKDWGGALQAMADGPPPCYEGRAEAYWEVACHLEDRAERLEKAECAAHRKPRRRYHVTRCKRCNALIEKEITR